MILHAFVLTLPFFTKENLKFPVSGHFGFVAGVVVVVDGVVVIVVSGFTVVVVASVVAVVEGSSMTLHGENISPRAIPTDIVEGAVKVPGISPQASIRSVLPEPPKSASENMFSWGTSPPPCTMIPWSSK